MTDKLIIFDTTLRDGEQSPGASMTKDEKLRIARQLERLKVDVIEAGFAAASPGDFDAILAKALAHDPAERYASVEALDRDLGLDSLARYELASDEDLRSLPHPGGGRRSAGG